MRPELLRYLLCLPTGASSLAAAQSRDKNDQWHFACAEELISSRVRPYWVDVCWRGVLVDRYALISVDNGHSLVPFSHTRGREPS